MESELKALERELGTGHQFFLFNGGYNTFDGYGGDKEWGFVCQAIEDNPSNPLIAAMNASFGDRMRNLMSSNAKTKPDFDPEKALLERRIAVDVALRTTRVVLGLWEKQIRLMGMPTLRTGMNVREHPAEHSHVADMTSLERDIYGAGALTAGSFHKKLAAKAAEEEQGKQYSFAPHVRHYKVWSNSRIPQGLEGYLFAEETEEITTFPSYHRPIHDPLSAHISMINIRTIGIRPDCAHYQELLIRMLQDAVLTIKQYGSSMLVDTIDNVHRF